MTRIARHICAHPNRLWWTSFLVLGFVFAAIPTSIVVAFAR